MWLLSLPAEKWSPALRGCACMELTVMAASPALAQ